MDEWIEAFTSLTDNDAPPDLYAQPVQPVRPVRDLCGTGRHSFLELDDFLDEDDDTYDWVVPGLIEHRDRVILTGGEGHGKMTLMRQIGIQVASGIHPFTLGGITPARVVLLDLQETEQQLRRALRPLRVTAGDRYIKGNLSVACRPEGLDIRGAIDKGYLVDLIMDTKPDLILGGPIYKLTDGDPIDETAAKPIATLLDQLRVMSGAAMILEAHMPYGVNGRQRVERPYGWSGWSRWPEFGLCLKDNDALSHWRGARDLRDWPAGLKRGGQWPFTPLTNLRDIVWSRIRDYCLDAGEQLSQRDLAKLCGVSVGTVNKVISDHRTGWDALSRGDSE